MFCPDLMSGQDIFDMRRIGREQRCKAAVRPDPYVAHMLPLEADAERESFFRGFMVPAH